MENFEIAGFGQGQPHGHGDRTGPGWFDPQKESPGGRSGCQHALFHQTDQEGSHLLPQLRERITGQAGPRGPAGVTLQGVHDEKGQPPLIQMAPGVNQGSITRQGDIAHHDGVAV